VKNQKGFTLIELMIAISLVAAISTGMLIAMRTGLLTLEKTQNRLEENRRVMALQEIMVRQIANVVPAVGICGPIFAGNEKGLRMVTSYSLAEGYRGSEQLVEYRILPDPEKGGLQLIEMERPYFSPASAAPFCAGQPSAPGQPFEIARGLAAARISYHENVPELPNGGNWVNAWGRSNMPSAVKIEIAPIRVEPGHLALQTVSVPIRINREVVSQYDDN
jgi:prepilin-type N-terminal cleavage/methylation domain-containing protein